MKVINLEDMQHGIRVANTCKKFAEYVGLQKKQISNLYAAALLHDIGKALVDQNILNKPGKLSSEEFEQVKRHSEYSYIEILKTGYPKEVALIALYHHENFDGTGYPLGLKGEDIPIESRILKIADVFDALTADRPYRSKLTVNEALEKMTTERETYDTELFFLFLEQFVIYGRDIKKFIRL